VFCIIFFLFLFLFGIQTKGRCFALGSIRLDEGVLLYMQNFYGEKKEEDTSEEEALLRNLYKWIFMAQTFVRTPLAVHCEYCDRFAT
jgi:hypothetical protein